MSSELFPVKFELYSVIQYEIQPPSIEFQVPFKVPSELLPIIGKISVTFLRDLSASNIIFEHRVILCNYLKL